MRMAYTLVLLRHGESDWNAKNLFTGWVDVDLTEQGRGRGRAAAASCSREHGLLPDVVHTSVLRRAIRTAEPRAGRRRPALDPGAPVAGGSTSATTARCRARTRSRRSSEFGEEQFMLWRRSYDTPPPPIADDDECSPGRRPALRRRCRTSCVPRTECLKDVVVRMLPYWYDAIVPDLRAGRPCWSPRTATRCARWSSTSTASPTTDIAGLNIPTGIPLRYDLDDDLRPIDPGRRVPRPRRGGQAAASRGEPGPLTGARRASAGAGLASGRAHGALWRSPVTR